MKQLSQPCPAERIDFELFKSNVCHKVKKLGDIDYMIDALESDTIREYYEKGWFPESFYLLAMLDYLSRENEIPLCTAYQDIRHEKLCRPLFPASILAMAAVLDDMQIKKNAFEQAIPEFLHFNIVENEIRRIF